MSTINKTSVPGYKKTPEEAAVISKLHDFESLSDEELQTLNKFEENINAFFPGKDMTEETNQLERNARSVGQNLGITLPEDEGNSFFKQIKKLYDFKKIKKNDI